MFPSVFIGVTASHLCGLCRHSEGKENHSESSYYEISGRKSEGEEGAEVGDQVLQAFRSPGEEGSG
jgi:hypothetical protein